MKTFAFIPVTLLFCLSVNLYAATYSGGDGTALNPYQISSVADWQTFMGTSADWGKQFILTADIDLTGITVTPIGSNLTSCFSGVFDGRGFAISNATINLPDANYVGIFGFVHSGQIRNVGAENVNITGKQSVGGLVGYLSGDSITFCYATGSVSATIIVGGLVGHNLSGSISFCYAMDSVSGSAYVGGLVGANKFDSITYSYSTGSVNGTAYAGGLVGYTSVSLTSTCFWDMESSGTTISAGGTGLTTEQMQTLGTYLSAGWDFVRETANGLHDFWQISTDDYPRLATYNWTLSGSGTTDSPYLIENVEDLTRVCLRPQACYSLTENLDLSGISWSAAIVPEFGGVFDGHGFTLSHADINLPNNYNVGIFGIIRAGGQVRNLGVVDPNLHGRFFIGGLVGANWGSITSCTATVSINETGVCIGGLIGYNDGLITSCHTTSSLSRTGESVNVGGLVGYNEEEGLIISCHATSMVSIAGDKSHVGGLVGYNVYGSITSCNVMGSVSGSGGDSSAFGGLAGYTSGSITSCNATVSVSGSKHVGGLAGWSSYGPISFCYATGSVNGSSKIGGLIGRIFDSTITSCYSTGSVIKASSASYVGGLVGYNDSGSIISCYTTNPVCGSSSVGGLIGYNNSGSVINTCYATGSVDGNIAGGLVGTNYYATITTCYSTGLVNKGISGSGLVGSKTSGSITYSFWDKETSGLTTSAGGTGKTTVEMKTLSTFTSAGWDFTNETANGTNDYWRMCTNGVNYPKLNWESIDGDFACPDGVNIEDLDYFVGRWLTNNCTSSNNYCGGTDMNSSGTVNIADLAMFAQHWLEGT
jgi:hypothetical protein